MKFLKYPMLRFVTIFIIQSWILTLATISTASDNENTKNFELKPNIQTRLNCIKKYREWGYGGETKTNVNNPNLGTFEIKHLFDRKVADGNFEIKGSQLTVQLNKTYGKEVTKENFWEHTTRVIGYCNSK
ncbi:hypothetical protein FJR38_25800 [Anabaena sp. UHCC 0253]|uniref:hypothetical protein n=1 Tax=Anabaena sp. UHCC 0253 TaxID=2590019 RepID=UPI0014457E77|nr:hypothetical protein [Anabaena sp. UHCC 0253]MTJ55833.1 hypothetical protein [Anabaena sp. UHCC 0253]